MLPRDADRPTVSEGRALAELLLAAEGDPPTAVFAHNDLMALGAIERLAAAGISCPSDISVVGYNDAPLTSFTHPPLTTIGLPGYELGRFAADSALSLIDSPERERSVLSLPPRLVVRGSTAPPPPARVRGGRTST